jgi:hypothetical protein
MDRPAADELAQLYAEWLDRFGEPPPIVAEPEIMRRVLRQVLERSAAVPWRADAAARSQDSVPRRSAWPPASWTGSG